MPGVRLLSPSRAGTPQTPDRASEIWKDPIVNKRLAAALARDDRREDAGMHADDRATCHTHQTWAETCEDQHARPTAGQLLAEAAELRRIRGR